MVSFAEEGERPSVLPSAAPPSRRRMPPLIFPPHSIPFRFQPKAARSSLPRWARRPSSAPCARCPRDALLLGRFPDLKIDAVVLPAFPLLASFRRQFVWGERGPRSARGDLDCRHQQHAAPIVIIIIEMREGRRGRDAPDRDQSRLWLSSCKDFFAQRRSCRSCTSLSAGSILYASTRPDPTPRRRLHHPIPVCSPSPSALFI